MEGLLVWNANSIRNKQHFLEVLTSNYKPAFIAITETHLSSDVLSSEITTDYTLFRRDRGSRGGGVAIGVKNSLLVNVTNSYVDPNIELVAVDVTISCHSFTLACFYRPPNISSLPPLFDWLESASSANIIIAGDFNIPDLYACDGAKSGIAKDFTNFMAVFGLDQIVDFPTHVKGNVLDLILSNCDPRPKIIGSETGLSDHTAIIADHPFLARPDNSAQAGRFRKIYLFDKADHLKISEVCSSLSSEVQELVEVHAGADTAWQLFKQKFFDAAKHIPIKTIKCTKKKWLTRDTI